jgi:hypothetical protein
MASRAEPPFYARKWAEILASDVSTIAAFLVQRSELADELRQSSPFAGAPGKHHSRGRDRRHRQSGSPRTIPESIQISIKADLFRREISYDVLERFWMLSDRKRSRRPRWGGGSSERYWRM